MHTCLSNRLPLLPCDLWLALQIRHRVGIRECVVEDALVTLINPHNEHLTHVCPTRPFNNNRDAKVSLTLWMRRDAGSKT